MSVPGTRRPNCFNRALGIAAAPRLGTRGRHPGAMCTITHFSTSICRGTSTKRVTGLLGEQARQAQKSLKDAQETERAASKSAQDWQQHAAALERQLKHAHTLASEGTDSLRSKLSQCAEALEQTEAELIKTRAQHAADTQKKEQLYSTRAQHMSQEHQASPKN